MTNIGRMCNLPGYTFRILGLVLFVVTMPGCATMHSRTINEDGSSHEHGVTVPPFSKQDLADFGYEQEVKGDGSYRQVIGSRGEGMDTTGQLEALKGIMALGQVLAPLLQQQQPSNPSTPFKTSDGKQLSINDVLAELIGSVNGLTARIKAVEDSVP